MPNPIDRNADTHERHRRNWQRLASILDKKTTVGSVKSVGLSVPAIFSVADSPITDEGVLTVTLAVENANKIFAGPTTGADATPIFRSLVAADIPDLSATYFPQSGTLTATHGGTSFSTYVLGDMLYSSAANTLSKLSGNTTTTKKFLSQTGTGSVSAAPNWTTITGTDVSGVALLASPNTLTQVLTVQNAGSGSPFFSNVEILTTGSSQSTAVLLESTFISTTQHWFFGSGSGAGNNNFRIFDLTAGLDVLNIQPSTGYVGFGVNAATPLHVAKVAAGGPYFSQVLIQAPGSNQDVAVALESTRASTTQRWFFGSGSGAGNNNFRIVDLTAGADALNIQPGTDNVGIGLTGPTAKLHVIAGTAAVGTAPLKLTSGVNLTTAEDGAFEYDGTHLYFTIGSTRHTLI